jgi:voltage-gated potassium channel
VARARYVLALRDDDAENAFIVLAAKEATGDTGAKTVALVNTSKHLEKIRRVQPDLVFSVQLLGAELLARAISGEPMDSQTITDLFFTKAAPGGKAA